MKITRSRVIVFTAKEEIGSFTKDWIVRFVPVDGTPGFTHRVIVNEVATGWLSATHKPTCKTAAFFIEKSMQDQKASDAKAAWL